MRKALRPMLRKGLAGAFRAVLGREHGRPSSRYALREHFLSLVSAQADTLEIGPFTKPVVRGPQVRYFDVLDRENLLARALAHGLETEGTPEIDYVSPEGDLSIVDRTFDAVVSSHCVEHQPDLIRHLRLVEAILRPGGSYYLIVPDKRFCFDFFIAESTLPDVLTAHVEGRRAHTLQSVIEHRAFTTHNDPVRHWLGDHGELEDIARKADEAADEWRRAAGRYLDVHAWQFTSASFEKLVRQLGALGLIHLQPTDVYPTPWGRLEFCAVLTKPERLASPL